MTRLLLSFVAIASMLPLTALGCAKTNKPMATTEDVSQTVSVANADTAVFAMGCFWCAETAFEGRPGIIEVVSGFSGGHLANPTYNDVTRGGTGHYEVIEVIYDPSVIAYEDLVYLFWRNVDPFDYGGQFCDRGDSYKSAILARPEQRAVAEFSLAEMQARFVDAHIATAIIDAAPFYPAEEYHQDFWRKDPDRYYSYRRGCARDARLQAIWGDEKTHDAVHVAGY